MNKSVLIGIGVFLSILIAGFFLLNKPEVKVTPSPAPEENQEAPIESEVMMDKNEEVREIQIEGKEFAFNPSTLTVKKGERVRITFKNVGTMEHNFVIDELNLQTEEINPDESDIVEFTVPDEGSLTFYCSIGSHRAFGMEGEFTITE